MCFWEKASSSNRIKSISKNSKQGSSHLSDSVHQSIKYHYIWDLDDGNPGFIKQTKRDYLKLYLDSNQDGYLTRSDDLIGKTKIKKSHRSKRLGRLIRRDQHGAISAFNSPIQNTTIQVVDSLEQDQETLPGHIGLDQAVGLKLIHPHGTVVAVFDHLIL
tara:strand:- start:62 stop:541 length:480 start_codon:yes stop_codon:yes gene_type:complete